MEDRYLFKAKRVDNGEWVTGQYVKGLDMYGKEVHLIFEPTTIFYSSSETDGWSEIDPSTICQCAGLKDKNGNLIWENDLVMTVYDGIEHTYVVKWDDSELGFKATNGKKNYGNYFQYLGCCDEIEVIGNIFDNPELLETFLTIKSY